MEGAEKSKDRVRRRCYECSRVEEELWKLAYERLLPSVRRRTEPQGLDAPTAPKTAVAVAKGA